MEMPPGPMPNVSINSSNTMMINKMMQMSFYWGKDATILFHGWPDNKPGMYVLALFFVFLLAFAIEVLSILPVKPTSTNPMLGALTQAIIYTFRMGFAYLVMLSVMSFNLGIFIAALAGHFVGFFLVKSRALAVPKPTETTYCTAVIPKV